MGPLWVVIATRDRPSELAEQLARLERERASLRARRVEVVVSDDGSCPPVEIPRRSWLRLVRSETSRGPNMARDAGARLSPPDAVIVELDDHDLLEPGALAELDRAFRAGAFLAFGDCLRVNSRGDLAPVGPVFQKGKYVPWRLRDEGALHVGVRAYRRALYDEVGGYRAEEFPGGDYALMLRMEARLRGRKIVSIPRPLCRVVTCASGISVRMAEEQRRAAELYRERIGSGDEGGPEPSPPDFSDVELRYGWLGREGGRELLDERSARLAGWEPLVSAIVPLYRSEKAVRACLRSLVQCMREPFEIAAVDDGSPDASGHIALEELAGREGALVVRLSRNTGYAHATNTGALAARGRYLLLFNADAVARPGFVEPMVRALDEHPDVAVVGNRHVRPSGALDSEGSEFSWETRSYRHVGRDIPDPSPRAHGARELVERDMVTFACALVRSSVWRELGGLDERYLRAYWEDADFCMRVRRRGLRVAYAPQSEIVHEVAHSRAHAGPELAANARLFRRRWVRTGLVDRFRRERGLAAHEGRIVCCMIACSEEEFVAAALESVYQLADRIIVVEGGTRHAVAAGLADPEGRSTDRTVEEIRAFPDPAGKIELVRAPGRPWRDKREQREEYARRLRPGDWMLLLDADEVFTAEGLWRLSALMHEADVVCPGFFLFWNNLSTLGTGRWDDFHQVKVIRWREGLSYGRDHNVPTDPRGVHVTALPGVRVRKTAERLYCHYSWAGKPDEKLRKKCAFYVAQNGPGAFPPDYFDRVFLAWRREPARVEREFGTHPYGGGSSARFLGEHPEPVRRLVAAGRLSGARERGA